MAQNKKLIEAGKLWQGAFAGDYADRAAIKQLVVSGSSSLREALTTTDLAAAFQSAAVQRVVEQYPKAERVWTKIAKRDTMEDFRGVEFREFTWDNELAVAENAGRAIIPGALAVVPELTEYPTFGFSTSTNRRTLHKHGARLRFSWEMVVNDDWGLIQSIPGRALEYALQTEEVEAFLQLASTTGPRADVFTGDLAPKSLDLTLENLSDAKTEVRSRKVNGRAVRVPRFALVVPPALEETARRILAISALEVTDINGTYTTTTANGDVELVVADVLVDIDQSAKADKTWYLVPAGGSDGTRDSILLSFLRGNETPDLRISAEGGNYLGGGAVPGLEGGLLHDDVQYRVRHVVTGNRHYVDALYASTGAV